MVYERCIFKHSFPLQIHELSIYFIGNESGIVIFDSRGLSWSKNGHQGKDSLIHNLTCSESQDVGNHVYENFSSLTKPGMVIGKFVSRVAIWWHKQLGNSVNFCRGQLGGLIQKMFHGERDQRLSWLEVQHLIYRLRGDMKEDISRRVHHCPLRRLIISTT